jgi:hypothetical protein
MAQIAWNYYQFTGDNAFLDELSYPLLSGAFEAYWSMLEEAADGSLHLPVSVSPEFKGSRDDAWGADASFQLAACHFLAKTLPQAAAVLGQTIDDRWQQVANKLPAYTVGTHAKTKEFPEHQVPRIELWQGMDLLESHRHHSHLGAIYPFCTIDPQDPQHAAVVRESIYHWVRTGPGAWSGWCVPWASIIHARCGNGDGAVAWLNFWQNNFTNIGRGTLHDSDFYGATTLHQLGSGDGSNGAQEIMQIEAGQGALHALCELLVQDRSDGIYVYPSPVQAWKDVSIEDVTIRGGHKLSVRIEAGKVQSLTVLASSTDQLSLWPGLGEVFTVDGASHQGLCCELSVQPGQRIVLERM